MGWGEISVVSQTEPVISYLNSKFNAESLGFRDIGRIGWWVQYGAGRTKSLNTGKNKFLTYAFVVSLETKLPDFGELLPELDPWISAIVLTNYSILVSETPMSAKMLLPGFRINFVNRFCNLFNQNTDICKFSIGWLYQKATSKIDIFKANSWLYSQFICWI